MRSDIYRVVSEIIKHDEKTFLFLVDVGVYGFREALEKHSNRVKNIGIFEDGMISVAAGMSIMEMIPIIYGINPFIVCRAFEQLKLDFGYQELRGNFITIGASYDFSKLGYSHYCPEDLALIKMIPGFQFLAPGTAKEFEALFRQTYNNDKPTYTRISDYTNKTEVNVEFGVADIIKRGKKATVIAVSTMLDSVIEACKDEDVTIIYYTTLMPFDKLTLLYNCQSGKILICEPHYQGILSYDVLEAVGSMKVQVDFVGLPREICRNYGTKEEKDEYFGLTVKNIRGTLRSLINE